MAIAFSLCLAVATPLQLRLPRHAPPQNPRIAASSRSTTPRVAPSSFLATSTKRKLLLNLASIISYLSFTQSLHLSRSSASESSGDAPASNPAAPSPTPKKLVFPGILNTKSWFQYFGNGFSIRVPPLFEDVMEPEDFSAGLSLYGDKVKAKKFAAHFASPDGSEVVSVVIRPTNQLKITFLEAKDVTDLGSLKAAAKIFVPGGANLYSARTIKIKEDDYIRTYYYYEFGIDEQRVAFVAAVNSGKAFIAGAAAPRSRWDEDGAKLRSAAISLSV